MCPIYHFTSVGNVSMNSAIKDLLRISGACTRSQDTYRLDPPREAEMMNLRSMCG
jgi:hypothetical protein